MPIYTVTITVEVPADKEREAYQIISHALNRAKLGDIIHIDSEVIASRPYEEEEVEVSELVEPDEILVEECCCIEPEPGRDGICANCGEAFRPLEDEEDEAYERAASRARLNDFEETGGKDWT